MTDKFKQEVAETVEVLKKGGIILYPTDTVWGIGCDATNPEAVEKIYRLKQSENKKSMLILLDNIDKVSLYPDDIPAVAWELFELSDKPLTLILPKAKRIADNLIPEEGTLGVRVVKHDFCEAVIRKLGRPLVSTSANISGKPSPVHFSEIADAIKQGVDKVVPVEYEGKPTGTPSSIIKLGTGSEVQVIRA